MFSIFLLLVVLDDSVHKTNVAGTLNMLGLAKRVGARFLLTSTSEVYGDPLQHPQKETYWGNVNPIGRDHLSLSLSTFVALLFSGRNLTALCLFGNVRTVIIRNGLSFRAGAVWETALLLHRPEPIFS